MFCRFCIASNSSLCIVSCCIVSYCGVTFIVWCSMACAARVVLSLFGKAVVFGTFLCYAATCFA